MKPRPPVSTRVKNVCYSRDDTLTSATVNACPCERASPGDVCAGKSFGVLTPLGCWRLHRKPMAASHVTLLLAPTAPWLLKPEGMFLIARVVGIATRNLADECSEKNNPYWEYKSWK